MLPAEVVGASMVLENTPQLLEIERVMLASS